MWRNDAIWRHRSGSTVAQVMACCLTAPSHYLNQCWLIIKGFCGIFLRTFSQETPPPSIIKIRLNITYIKLDLNVPGANEFKKFSSTRVNVWSGSTVAQVMACCLTAPSHYLNQCWLIISEVWWHLRTISQEMPPPSITKIRLNITYIKLHNEFKKFSSTRVDVWWSLHLIVSQRCSIWNALLSVLPALFCMTSTTCGETTPSDPPVAVDAILGPHLSLEAAPHLVLMYGNTPGIFVEAIVVYPVVFVIYI